MLDRDDSRLDGSWLDWAEATFRDGNEDLVMRTRSLLTRIVDDPALHPKLINTLSMLEHMGSHKIMATQHSAAIDQPTLKHVAEEAHHAYFMKRQAEKAAGRALEYVRADLLAPAAARMYFQRLEAAMVRVLGATASARAAYLYMSMIVEFRALWFYRLYQQILRKAGHPLSLKRVLGEEQAHLQEMAGQLEQSDELDDARVDAFMLAERRLYERMLGAIFAAVA